ncbi:MAG: hypothetical protein CMM02_18320 [Rhodopirellula sp.]|nr:hypothetical protein [Rhodopirellula sp.]|tara:strand:+ start:2630 stop:3298 length:669 start_codon:yes stop_codon:yes gene_type:complete
MKLTAGERKAIHLALEETNGVVDTASKLVGMTGYKLKKLIDTDHEFNTRWGTGEVKVPTETDVIHRPDPADAFVTKLKQEEAALSQGLEAVGIKGKCKEEAIATSAFASQHLSQMRQMTTGGLLKDFMELGVVFKEIRDELSQGQEPERENVLYEALFSAVKFRNEINREVIKGALIDAQIKQKTEENGKKSTGKPGFAPMNNIMIKTDGKVEVSQKDAKEN